MSNAATAMRGLATISARRWQLKHGTPEPKHRSNPMTDRELIDTLRWMADALDASDKVQFEDEIADWLRKAADRIEGEEQA